MVVGLTGRLLAAGGVQPQAAQAARMLRDLAGCGRPAGAQTRAATQVLRGPDPAAVALAAAPMRASQREGMPAVAGRVRPPAQRLPGVWPAAWAEASGPEPVCPSGHGPLDAVLRGGGWPLGAMLELVVPDGGAAVAAWVGGLVVPALRQALQGPQPTAGARRRVVWVDPPAVPSAWAWALRGVDAAQWVQVQAGDAARRLWACEQALACPAVGAVLAWLPHAPFQALRRLQWAAARHGGLLWVCRPLVVQPQPSPAVLRLQLQPGTGPGELQVRVLKQRGMAAARTVHLPLTDPGLRPWLPPQAAPSAQSDPPARSDGPIEPPPPARPVAEPSHEPTPHHLGRAEQPVPSG